MKQAKRPRRYWMTYLWTWPWDLLSWPALLLLNLLWGAKLHWLEGVWFEARPGGWLARRFGECWAGLCLGHGGIFRPGYSGGDGIDTPTEFHEHFHAEQYEAAMLLAFLVATAVAAWHVVDGGHPPYPLVGGIWLLGGVLAYVASMLQAWLRGEPAYEGSHLEKATSAATEQWLRERR